MKKKNHEKNIILVLCLIGFPLYSGYESKLSQEQIEIHEAIINDDQWRVWELLAGGFDLRKPLDRDGTKILSFAATRGRADIVQSLLEDHYFDWLRKQLALGDTLEQSVYQCLDCYYDWHAPIEHLGCLALLIKAGAQTDWLCKAAQKKEWPMYTLDGTQDNSEQEKWMGQRLSVLKKVEKTAQEMPDLIKACKDQRLCILLKNPKRILILD